MKIPGGIQSKKREHLKQRVKDLLSNEPRNETEYTAFIENANASIKEAQVLDIEEAEEVLTLHVNIAFVYCIKGKYGVSETKIFGVLETIRQKKMEALEARCLMLLTVIFFEKGRFQETIEHGEKGIELYVKLENSQNLASLLNNVAGAHFELGHYERALYFYYQSLKYVEKYGNPNILGTISYNILDCLILQKRYDVVEKEFERFKIRINDNNQDENMLVWLYIAYCKFYYKKEDSEKILDYAEKLKVLSRKTKVHLHLVYSAWHNAKIRNKLKRHKEAFTFALELLEYSLKSKSTSKQLLAYLAIGEILCDDVENQEYYWKQSSLLDEFQKETIRVLKKAESFLEELSFTDKKIYIYNLLEKFYVQNKDFEKAYTYSVKSRQLETAIYDIEKNDLVFRLQEEFNAKESQQKINFQEKLLIHQREINASLEVFAYRASHDMREPLRNINSFAKVLQNERKQVAEEDYTEILDFIINCSERLLILTKDLLEYSRLGRIVSSTKIVPLKNIIEAVKSNLSEQLNEANSVLEFEEDMPMIFVQESLLIQLFQNLISNALKFRNKDIQTIINVSSLQENDQIIYFVKDNGIGIEENKFKKIFEPFARLHHRKAYEGSGIGLTSCQKIVEQYGGKIWVESTVGKGSTFYFTFPNNNNENQEIDK